MENNTHSKQVKEVGIKELYSYDNKGSWIIAVEKNEIGRYAAFAYKYSMLAPAFKKVFCKAEEAHQAALDWVLASRRDAKRA